MKTINPATGKIIKEYQNHSDQQLEAILRDASEAQSLWSQKPISERCALLAKLADLLLEEKDRHAQLMSTEMGKSLKEAKSEIEKCASMFEYYAKNTPEFLKNEAIETDAQKSYVSFEPLGLILGIMPWNFPYWQVFRFAIPNLAAGNGALLKHAENVTGCALAIEQLFQKAGFPKDIFRTLLIDHNQIEKMIRDPRLKGVSLTGSDKAGKEVAQQCGKQLKKSVLELGGSDPFIVLEDADLDACVDTALDARLVNSGQSCIASKRFIVVKSALKPFIEKLQNRLSENPGLLARKDLRDQLHRQVQESIEKGAKLLQGGEIPDRDGFYYPITILTKVQKGMPAYDEETFGPVFAIIEAENEKETLQIANDTRYGLGASLWTKDLEKGREMAEKIEAGMVFVNGQTHSDARLPFGGIKNSGYGRELSHYGLKEFVNIKTVVIQ